MDRLSTKVRGTWVISRDKEESTSACLIREGKLIEGTKVRLRRQPNNKHDMNAIAVYLGPNKIGYLPRNLASRLASPLDDGCVYEACVTKIGKHTHWDGSTYPKVSLALFQQDVNKPDKLEEILTTAKKFDGVCGVYKIYNSKERKPYID